MNELKTSVVEAWFRKAENDLRTANYTLTMTDPPCDTACFHAQQCAEKYLKGLLAFREIVFPKTHDIELLVGLANTVEPGLTEELGAVEILSAYGVETRYPGEAYYEIPIEDAREAIALAAKVRDVVRRRVPPTVYDSSPIQKS